MASSQQEVRANTEQSTEQGNRDNSQMSFIERPALQSNREIEEESVENDRSKCLTSRPSADTLPQGNQLGSIKNIGSREESEASPGMNIPPRISGTGHGSPPVNVKKVTTAVTTSESPRTIGQIPLDELEDSAIQQLIQFENDSVATSPHHRMPDSKTGTRHPQQYIRNKMNVSGISAFQRENINSRHNYELEDLDMIMDREVYANNQNKAVSQNRRKVFNLMQKRQFGPTLHAPRSSPLKNLTIASMKIVPKRASPGASQTINAQTFSPSKIMRASDLKMHKDQKLTEDKQLQLSTPESERKGMLGQTQIQMYSKVNFQISPGVKIQSYAGTGQMRNYGNVPISTDLPPNPPDDCNDSPMLPSVVETDSPEVFRRASIPPIQKGAGESPTFAKQGTAGEAKSAVALMPTDKSDQYMSSVYFEGNLKSNKYSPSSKSPNKSQLVDEHQDIKELQRFEQERQFHNHQVYKFDEGGKKKKKVQKVTSQGTQAAFGASTNTQGFDQANQTHYSKGVAPPTLRAIEARPKDTRSLKPDQTELIDTSRYTERHATLNSYQSSITGYSGQGFPRRWGKTPGFSTLLKSNQPKDYESRCDLLTSNLKIGRLHQSPRANAKSLKTVCDSPVNVMRIAGKGAVPKERASLALSKGSSNRDILEHIRESQTSMHSDEKQKLDAVDKFSSWVDDKLRQTPAMYQAMENNQINSQPEMKIEVKPLIKSSDSYATQLVASVEVLPVIQDLKPAAGKNASVDQYKSRGGIKSGTQILGDYPGSHTNVLPEDERSNSYLQPVGENVRNDGSTSLFAPQESIGRSGDFRHKETAKNSHAPEHDESSPGLRPLKSLVTSERIVIKERPKADRSPPTGGMKSSHTSELTFNNERNVEFGVQADGKSEGTNDGYFNLTNSQLQDILERQEQQRRYQKEQEEKLQQLAHQKMITSLPNFKGCSHTKFVSMKKYAILNKIVQDKLPCNIQMMLGYQQPDHFLEEEWERDLDQIASDSLQAISLTKMYRDKQEEITSYDTLEKKARAELAAYECDIPSEMGHGHIDAQPSHLGCEMVEEGSSNNTGSPGGSGLRIPHQSETRNWNISNQERQDLIELRMNQHSEVRQELIGQDEQRPARNTADPPPTDYKPINPTSLLQLGASQGTCSAVSEGEDDMRNMRGAGTPLGSQRVIGGPSQRTTAQEAPILDRTGGIKKLELRVTHGSELGPKNAQAAQSNVFRCTASSIMNKTESNGPNFRVVAGGVAYHQHQSRVLQEKKKCATKAKSPLDTYRSTSPLSRSPRSPRSNESIPIREKMRSPLGIVGVRAGPETQPTPPVVIVSEGAKGSPHILLQMNNEFRDYHEAPLIDKKLNVQHILRESTFTNQKVAKGSTIHLKNNNPLNRDISNELTESGLLTPAISQEVGNGSLNSIDNKLNIVLNENSTNELLQAYKTKQKTRQTKEVAVGSSSRGLLRITSLSPGTSTGTQKIIDDTGSKRKSQFAPAETPQEDEQILKQRKESKQQQMECQNLVVPEQNDQQVQQPRTKVSSSTMDVCEYEVSNSNKDKINVEAGTIIMASDQTLIHDESMRQPTLKMNFASGVLSNEALFKKEMVDAGSSPIKTGISLLKDSHVGQDTNTAPPSPPVVATEQPSEILVHDNIIDGGSAGSDEDDEGIEGRHSTLYKPQTKTNVSSQQEMSPEYHLLDPIQNKALIGTKTTVFMTHATRDSDNQLAQTMPRYYLAPELPAQKKLNSSSTRRSYESKIDLTQIKNYEKQNAGQLLNQLTKPKATHNQCRKPLDKLLTEEQMTEFAKILVQVKDEGCATPVKPSKLAVRPQELQGNAIHSQRMRETLKETSQRHSLMQSGLSDHSVPIEQNKRRSMKMYGEQVMVRETSMTTRTGLKSMYMAEPRQPWSPKMGVTAAGTPFVFTNVNSLQSSYAKTNQILNAKGMSITQKSFGKQQPMAAHY